MGCEALKPCGGSGPGGGDIDEPLLRDRLGVKIGLEPHQEVVGRGIRSPALGPLDDEDSLSSLLVEPKVGDFGGASEPVEVGMEERQPAIGVLGEQDEAGAAHRRRRVETAAEALGEDGFANAEFAGE